MHGVASTAEESTDLGSFIARVSLDDTGHKLDTAIEVAFCVVVAVKVKAGAVDSQVDGQRVLALIIFGLPGLDPDRRSHTRVDDSRDHVVDDWRVVPRVPNSALSALLTAVALVSGFVGDLEEHFDLVVTLENLQR